MFRIECFVDDSKLVSVLHALAGKVKTMDVQPVVNVVEKQNGELRAATPGSLTDVFAAHIEKSAAKTFTRKDVQMFLESIGRPSSNAQYMLQQAVKRKLLTKHGKGTATQYEKVRK